MIYGRIRRYFTAHSNLTVGNITSKDIEYFYDWMFESGVVANTIIHYHTVLHSAFKRSFKDDLIDANPFDRIDRPKKNDFQPVFLSAEEMQRMFESLRGTRLELPVLFAAFYGFRRGEVLGLKWDAIDFERGTISVKCTVTTVSVDGKHKKKACNRLDYRLFGGGG